MKPLTRKRIALVLVVALLMSSLTGCGLLLGARETVDDQLELIVTPTPIPIDPGIPCDGRVSISFVLEGDVINPYTSRSRDNLSASGLVYEGLYALAEHFTAVPVLAESVTTLDGRRHTIQIRQGITFHDGQSLTVADVIYSLNRARSSVVFGGRLEIVHDYERRFDADGVAYPYEVDIILSRVHGNLPVLLTFPIIPWGSGGQAAPPGTGPFRFIEDYGPPRLLGFAEHPRYAELPVNTIYLREIATLEQMTAHFNSGYLDIAALELTATGEPQLAGTRELRHFEATLMDYIGFNVHRPEVRNLEVRQAINFALDRLYITDNIMRGHAVPSPLPFHPALFYYDHDLAARLAFDLSLARQILAGAVTLADVLDGELDAENGAIVGEGEEAEEGATTDRPPVQLTLLVASGNTSRLDAAAYIAASIAELGYQVIVDDRPYNEFLFALQAGDFDLYYGQVRLQPDFDLMELLFGTLAFGGTANRVERRVLDDFLASGQTDRAYRAERLSRAILEDMPFAVIGFRHLTVATQRGVVIGMQPTQENLYHNVWDWMIDLPSLVREEER
ncbi:MAG: ABC transporter substrate-binding protein [Oscillospiraceae bacterium]|nr:ABC transporter substrate-binding protein [Oscillospiraceae bacterium]